ncbi:glucose/galactose MFS transporter [Massilia phosphatilytica]|nr:glucose/galactose MFS transporter [Massilia phosphatilytica]
MASIPSTSTVAQPRPAQGTTTVPLIIITMLFFMWGLLTSLNDILIPHLKAVYTLTYVQAMLVQFCFFGAYFLVSVAAGMLIKKIGYQRGVVVGLLVAAAGCAFFYPAAEGGYGLFLFALFILASGVTVLQVAANPYVTVLGDPRTASSRLTLTQAFNSLGTTVGPLLGGLMILSGAVLEASETSGMTPSAQAAYRAGQAAMVQTPYLMLAGVLVLLAIVFAAIRLPNIAHDGDTGQAHGKTPILAHRHLVLGVGAIFLYVGGEVSLGSFLINFLGDSRVASLSQADAAHYVSFYWGAAMVGRFAGFAAMRYISPGKALMFNAGGAVLLLLCSIFGQGRFAMWSILMVGLCNSIMFPTIFSMALRGLGARTGQASGLLCMGIVGGAVVPFVQGLLADTIGLRASYLVPVACYVFVLYYGWKYAAPAVPPLPTSRH